MLGITTDVRFLDQHDFQRVPLEGGESLQRKQVRCRGVSGNVSVTSLESLIMTSPELRCIPREAEGGQTLKYPINFTQCNLSNCFYFSPFVFVVVVYYYFNNMNSRKKTCLLSCSKTFLGCLLLFNICTKPCVNRH